MRLGPLVNHSSLLACLGVPDQVLSVADVVTMGSLLTMAELELNIGDLDTSKAERKLMTRILAHHISSAVKSSHLLGPEHQVSVVTAVVRTKSSSVNSCFRTRRINGWYLI